MALPAWVRALPSRRFQTTLGARACALEATGGLKSLGVFNDFCGRFAGELD